MQRSDQQCQDDQTVDSRLSAGRMQNFQAKIRRNQPEPSVNRRGMWFIYFALIAYAVAFFGFFPSALTISDEVAYVRQAVLFSQGRTSIDIVDPLTGGHRQIVPSGYPPGTSALMAPLTWLGGWQAVFLLGLVAIGLSVICTARWIGESGVSPLYALILFCYPPTLVIARTAMSDVVSSAFVAAGLWMFWRDDSHRPWRRLIAGFLAGASYALRDSNPLLFVLFFAGAMFRRERHIWALVVGGVAGVSCRFAANAVIFGKLFYTGNYPGFTGAHAAENALIYGTALLVMIPGGIFWALRYRGRRHYELIGTVLCFLSLYVLYDYNAAPSAGLKQWILAPRFFIPLVPILAFAIAHTVPAALHGFIALVGRHQTVEWQKRWRIAWLLWLTAVAGLGMAINWNGKIWCEKHQQVTTAVYNNTRADRPLLTNTGATAKFINELYGKRLILELSHISLDQAATLIQRYGSMQIVILDRNDSSYWIKQAQHNAELIVKLSSRFPAVLTATKAVSGLGVLKVWEINPQTK